MSFLDHASTLEILQLVLAVFGVCLALWRLWIAVENGLQFSGPGTTMLHRYIVESQVMGELFRIFKQGCLMGIGIVSVVLPPPTHGTEAPIEELLQTVLVRVGLMVLTISAVADSLIQEVRRRKFLVKLAESLEEKKS